MKRKFSSNVAVLDFSGTLSPGAAHFGQAEILQQALQDSGLTGLGLDGPTFWNKVINPAWQEGSTTARGYSRLLCEGVLRLATARGKIPDEEAVSTAASLFTAYYLDYSTIHPRWFPLLKQLVQRKITVVATDHYAEATGHIIRQLKGAGLHAAPALYARSGHILVANSADLGAHKESPSFWKALRHTIKEAAPSSLLLVDDFGYNEQREDNYSRAEMVFARRTRTVAAIELSWHIPVSVFPFFLHNPKDYPALLDKAVEFLTE
ncbi:MAG: hypothetical protein GX878_00870 [Firmicutes bacterium]|nr:hypothetical protein [Bacillota bacterium]